MCPVGRRGYAAWLPSREHVGTSDFRHEASRRRSITALLPPPPRCQADPPSRRTACRSAAAEDEIRWPGDVALGHLGHHEGPGGRPPAGVVSNFLPLDARLLERATLCSWDAGRLLVVERGCSPFGTAEAEGQGNRPGDPLITRVVGAMHPLRSSRVSWPGVATSGR